MSATCKCGYTWNMRSPHSKQNLPARCPKCGNKRVRSTSSTHRGHRVTKRYLDTGQGKFYDRKMYEDLAKQLHRMNINNAVLFPGLDGFSQSLWTRVGLELKDKLLLESKELLLYP